MTGAFDAIVVGSGMGGLGLAAILAKRGRRVLVLERHSIVGGMTHTFRRRGFEFDVGLHYLGKVQHRADPLRCAFDYVTDGALAWAPMRPTYDRVVFGDLRFTYTSGEGPLRDALVAAFPAEADAVDAYVRLVRRVAKRAQGFFLEKLLPRPLGLALGPVLGGPFRRWAKRSTSDVLASLTRDPRLAAVLAAQWGNYGLPPRSSSFAMHALVADFYMDGGSYPVGGAARIFETIAPVIARAGGEVRASAEVEAILVERGRVTGVRLISGETIRAPIVASDVGVARTLDLLPPEARPAGAEKEVSRLASESGHVALYLGLEGSARELGLRAENVWVHAGLDHDANVAAHARDPEAPLPVVYVNSPSAKDPAFAARHPGKSTIIAIAPAPLAHFETWHATKWRRRGAAYDEMKARIAARLLDVVHAELPRTRGKVVYQELSTPLSTAHFTGRRDGAMYGLSHGPPRFFARHLRPSWPTKGLFVVGQDAVTVGVGASLMSAVLAASLILKRNVLADVVRAGAEPARTLHEESVVTLEESP